MYYYGFRYYSGGLSRWLSRDPAGNEAWLLKQVLPGKSIVKALMTKLGECDLEEQVFLNSEKTL